MSSVAANANSIEEGEPARSNPIILVNCAQILPCLYLGGITAAQQTQHLVDQGIRAVVCCVREQEFPESDFHDDLEYYRVDVEDVSREPIELFWPEATEFIHEHVTRGEPVFVHCRAGVSRSASTVLAYLVSYQSYSLHDAFFHTRRRRPVVTPNLGFMEKLCEYEAEKRQTATTIDFENYKSWYSGDTVANEPKLAVGDSITFAFEPLSRQVSPESEACSDCSRDCSPTHSDASPRSPEGGRSKGRLRLMAAAKKIIKKHWLSNARNGAEIELDLPAASQVSGVAKERIAGIKTLLLRYAAQDKELGYCQGMHLVAALFTAASFSQGGSYFRFQACIRSVRGLWLPGFPLLEEGLMHFAEVAKTTTWYEHLCTHAVRLNSCLSEAWLTMFTTWLPLPTLVECLEFLEGHGLSGVLAMTLALLDEAAEDILEAEDEEAIMEVLEGFEERNLKPKKILLAVQNWLPKTNAAVSAFSPQALAKHGAEYREGTDAKYIESPDAKASPRPPRAPAKIAESVVPCKREGSRVWDECGLPLLRKLPDMANWIVCEAHEEKEKELPRAYRRLSWSMQGIS